MRAVLDNSAFLALSPVLAAQGIAVRRRALSLDEPTGPRRGQTGKGPLLRLLILGDSSAAGVGVDHQDQALLGRMRHYMEPHVTLEWQLVAKCGAHTRDTIDRLAAAGPRQLDWVVIGLGVNDVTHGVPMGRWLRQCETLYDRLERDWGNPRVVVSGMPPLDRFPLLPQPLRWAIGRRAQRFDLARQRIVAARPALHALPFDGELTGDVMARDGFHPGPPVYDRWAELAAGVILGETLRR